MVVVPVQVLAVLALPDEIDRTRMPHRAAVRIGHLFRRGKSMSLIPAVSAIGIPGNRAEYAENSSVAQRNKAVLLGNVADFTRHFDTVFAVRKRFPMQLCSVLFRVDVIAF